MRRVIPAIAAVLGILIGFFLIGCGDTMGPDEYQPQFQKVYNAGGDGGGGGGGGGGGASAGFYVPGCSSPTVSAECFRKFVLLVGGAGALTACGGTAATTFGATAFACGMGGLAWGEQAQGWLETPDCRSCLAPGLPRAGDPDYPTISPDPHVWGSDQ